MLEVTEVEFSRIVYGAGDGKAINRHSSRDYKCGDKVFTLDRNLSFLKPSFQIIENNKGLCPVLKVDGNNSFGEGISWKKAEVIAKKVIAEYVSSQIQ